MNAKEKKIAVLGGEVRGLVKEVKGKQGGNKTEKHTETRTFIFKSK